MSPFSLPLFSFTLSCSCHVCGFETELNVQFVSHMSLHVDKEQWMFSICCTACDFVTMEEAEIKTHIGTKHTGDHSCLSFSHSSSIPCTPEHLPPGRSIPTTLRHCPFLPWKEGLSQGMRATFPCSHNTVSWHALCLTALKDSQVQMWLRGAELFACCSS